MVSYCTIFAWILNILREIPHPAAVGIHTILRRFGALVCPSYYTGLVPKEAGNAPHMTVANHRTALLWIREISCAVVDRYCCCFFTWSSRRRVCGDLRLQQMTATLTSHRSLTTSQKDGRCLATVTWRAGTRTTNVCRTSVTAAVKVTTSRRSHDTAVSPHLSCNRRALQNCY